jgi:hypothetical protein
VLADFDKAKTRIVTRVQTVAFGGNAVAVELSLARCKTPDSTVCGPIQLSPAAQRDRLRDAEGYARRASAGDSSGAGSEGGRGAGTAEESPPAGGVMDETDCSRLPTMQN